METGGFKRFYFLSPTRNYVPNRRVKLGNIIPDPTLPDEPLNEKPFPNLPNVDRHDEDGYSFEGSVAQSRGGSIWATFLARTFGGLSMGVSADASMAENADAGLNLSCKKVTTLEFTPRRSFLDACVQDPDIQALARERNWFQGPVDVFMITGVKIAKGASSTITFAKDKNIHLHASADLNPSDSSSAATAAANSAAAVAGGSLPAAKVGVDVERSSAVDKVEAFERADNFVLGYRLRLIRLKRSGEIKLSENVAGGTTLEDATTIRLDEDGTVVIDEVPDSDCRGSEFDMCEIEIPENELLLFDTEGSL